MKRTLTHASRHASSSQAAHRLPIEGDNPRPLTNAEIDQLMQRAFTPLRCAVTFMDEGSTVALRLRALDGREFSVEAKHVESLRNPRALEQYVTDVKTHLMRRNVAFNPIRGTIER